MDLHVTYMSFDKTVAISSTLHDALSALVDNGELNTYGKVVQMLLDSHLGVLDDVAAEVPVVQEPTTPIQGKKNAISKVSLGSH